MDGVQAQLETSRILTTKTQNVPDFQPLVQIDFLMVILSNGIMLL